MADRAGSSSGSGTAPTAEGPDAIRNVVLVGPSGGGKTTLVEALLVSAGVLSRPGSVTDGTTVCDFDEAEIRQQRSVGLAVAALSHQGIKVNLVDTPGYADFVGELRAGLRAADCALFVIAANEGVDEPTKSLWQECSQVGMPRAVVITKLDHARANYAEALAAAQIAFGDKVLPLYLPTSDGLIGLLSQTQYAYANGTRCETAPGASDADRIEEARGSLIEGIIEESEDGSLMERYLGGEQIDESILIEDLAKAVARGSFFPVIPVCASTGVGTLELLEVATRGFPSPREHPLPEVFTPQGVTHADLACDVDSPLLAEVVKTTSDPYVGRVSLVRVFAGTIKPDATVHVSGHFSSFFGSANGNGAAASTHPDHDEDERIGVLSFPLGKQQRPATKVVAGDICAIDRLSRAETGDTLSDKSEPLVLKPWTMPEPLLPMATEAHAKTDEDKLAVGLSRGWPPKTQRCASSRTRRPTRSCSGAWARPMPAWYSTRSPTDTASPSTPSSCGCRCAKPSAATPRGTTGTSSSPVGTASTGSATSKWNRFRRARGSSSSTRWSVERCHVSSFPAWRRASEPRWTRACTPGTRLSTSG